MAANFSIIEALDTLCTSVPQWHTRLDELNGQIAQRQIELARLEENERPPTRSIKNQGSTESLRPKDGDDNPFASMNDNADGIQMNPFATPKLDQNECPGNCRPSSSSRVTRAAAVTTPPPTKANSNPRASGTLTRQLSHTTPPTQRSPNVLRKRKTESLASGESIAPKYRTRSMIIVYYDSAVQTAFEELCKFVSASRNSMRKGKMAVKMAEMKRAAELEVAAEENENDDDEDEDDNGLNNMLTSNGNLAQRNVPIGRQGQSVPGRGDMDGAAPTPQLKFVSTRQMGPPRDLFNKSATMGSTLSLGLLRGYNNRRGGNDAPDIFDELDKGLEWCQSQCEHAAHQFLRDGECGTEIANIKRKLSEVKEKAEKEMERLKAEEATNLSVKAPAPEETKSRELKRPQVRREFGSNNPRDLEVDDMEVDDEAVDIDIELPSKLVFKRSRDIANR
ncbi:hypothetical protein G7Y89_g14849 [Cudoniella acicularis]|uniref:Uncharacterized protein n=1 Tax=Cudoniella acicularis TaxID=354080 RepID=A0A8H4QZ90_9HELO|nr:hypothetical protein G7Y89_g14849 [Cudoniella acicularis]